MKVQYTIKKMPLLKQSLCMGDLIRYYGESKFKLIESVRRIEENRGLSSKMLNTIRKHTNVGMTIDGLVTNLQMASGTDIFKFKINGVDPTEMFTDEDVQLEIYMNPLYFVTKGAISGQLPGFRRKPSNTETEIEMKARQEQTKWLKWFEKELNKYHPSCFWKKNIMDLDKD